MKHLVKFATVAAMAAGLSFAQTAPPAAPAQPQLGRMHAGIKGAMRKRMMERLNLTDAQKAQAKAIFQQAKQNAQPLKAQLKQNREALAAAVKANDVAQIHSLSLQRGNLEGQMLGIRSEAQAKFYAGLTPDQRAKADQMRQQFKARMQQRMKQKKAANNG
jgi:Spy/CpxP family protein refolding chaperone